MKLKRYLAILLFLVLGGILLIFVFNEIVNRTTEKYIYFDSHAVPKNKVGVVLGTSKYLRNGQVNLYYQFRIEAVCALFRAGKIDFILVSGDNSQESYNEPKVFKDDLVEKGIPKHRIFLDYAGFRTLDSVVRANKVFGQNKFTIVSQHFHVQRALYIARKKHLPVVGFVAQGVPFRYGFKTQIRELLARTLMMIDLYIINRQPKFLGEQIIIE